MSRGNRLRPIAAEHIRRRLNGLSERDRRRIDNAVADLADGTAEGLWLPNLQCRLYETFQGDEIVYEIHPKDRTLIIIDIRVAETAA